MERKFGEFRESDKSLKYEVKLKILCLTCVFLVLWQYVGFLHKRLLIQIIFNYNNYKYFCH